MKNNFNILTGRTEDHLQAWNNILIHKDALQPFLNLQAQAKQEIGADLQIISSFRDFERQRLIWNDKAQGKRSVLDDQNQVLKINELTSTELLEKILRFSAIPGASRHHWGSDFDIFDLNKLNKKDVQLIGSECEDGGAFCELHLWLDEKIASRDSFDFFRPYDLDLGGVAPEKWHISFAPIAQDYYSNYTIEVFEQNLQISEIYLKEVIMENSSRYFEKFVQNITPQDS